MTIPDVRQQAAWDCGPAVVGAVLSLFGREPIDVPHTPQDGTDPRTIEHVLRRAGLGVQSGEMNLSDLAHHTRRGRPVLCPLRLYGFGHWIVVSGVDRQVVRFHDPMAGNSFLSRSEFLTAWRDFDRLPAIWDRWGIAVENRPHADS